MTLKIETIGEERQPVIVLDNAVSGAADLVGIAAAERFSATAPYYPGVRAPAPKDYAQSLAFGLQPLIGDVFGLDAASLSVTACDFSLVTTPPARLAAIQRLPHYDGVDPNVLAVLHYLCDESHGGTDFYRHRATGFETISEPRYAPYKKRLEVEISENGEPAQDYLGNSTAQFQMTAGFSCAFNRILIYRGTMLHSGNIPLGHCLSASPREGRLTVNTFISGAAAET